LKKSNTVLLFNVRRAAVTDADAGSDYLGLFYLAAVLEKRGYDPWVFHGDAHEVPGVLARESEWRNITAVGFGCDFENQTVVEELSLLVKETYGYPVVVGGPQAIALQEDFFIKAKCDFIIRGEAEETLPQLLDFMTRGEAEKEGIAGLSWFENDIGVVANPQGQPVSELDSLPLPAYHRSLHVGRVYGRNVFTGRGCPFACAFCHESSHKKQVRLRAVDNVLQEIRRSLDLYPQLNYFTILDDTFTLNPGRVEAFCEGINEVRSVKDLVWYCEGHVHTLAKWPEMLKQMVNAGLVRLQIGVETGSQDVLRMYGKKITIEEIEFVVKEAVSAGVPQIATNLIIGGPLENEGTVNRTLSLVDRLLNLAPGAIDILTGFLRPYPGTAITENPAAFQLNIPDPSGVKSVDDYPLVLAGGSSPEDIIGYRLRVSRHIQHVMNELMNKKQVSHETIRSQYRSAADYGINSLWYQEVFKKNQLLNEYYRLLTGGAAICYSELPIDKLIQWRPQRTMEIRKVLSYESGFPKIGRYVLSPLEFELLLRCTGKLRLEDVIEDLYQMFGDRFGGKGDFNSNIIELLVKFDRMHWVVFCRL
jgi:radical SAM superfamily enzyme YgiQ (UPF0313 family)